MHQTKKKEGYGTEIGIPLKSEVYLSPTFLTAV